MKDALVTLIGGGGFLGRYVAQDLLKRGARVRIVQRRPRDAWFLKSQGGLGQTQFVAGDVGNAESIANALAGADAVVNLAGTFKASDFQRIHVDGPRIVGEAATRAGVTAFVQISAIGAAQASPAAYGRTKWEGEQAARAAYPQATILRPSVLFGREDAFVNRFAGMIAGLPVVPVLRGAAKFQPAYVADVADAVVAALADPGTFGGHTYELGGPDVVTLAELHRWIAREVGRDVPLLELPDAIGRLLPMLPFSPITSDQWKMLAGDTVVAPSAVGFDAFDIHPTPLATVAPAWLVRFRRHGRFGKLGAA